MFVRNNSILFCLDGCLVLKWVKAVCFFICTWNLVSLSFLKRVITRWSCSCLVLLFLHCYVLLVGLKIAQEESLLTERFLFQTPNF